MLPSRIPAFNPSASHPHDQTESSNRQQQSPSTTSAHHIAQRLLANPQQTQALQQTWRANIRTALPMNPMEARQQALQTMLDNWVSSLPIAEKQTGEAMKKNLLNKKPHQKSLLLAFETSSLPDFFPYFTDLEHIQITCKTKTIPASIVKLKHLKILTITAPELTELPSTLDQLNDLSSLLLRQCYNLSNLPSSVSRLNKLTELRIENTRRTNPLPSNSSLIPNLKKVFITYASSIGNTFDQLTFNKKLELLSLSNVPFHSQDLQTMPALAALKTFEISTNTVLSDIPPAFIQAHPKLIHLSVRYCSNFQGLPPSVNLPKQLKTLDLKNNEVLHFIPETIGQLRKLQTLNLLGCRALRELPQSILSLPTTCNIHLEETGLSLNILEPLSRHIGGPQIHYSLPPVDLSNIGTLAEEAQKWFNNAMTPKRLSPAELGHIEQLDPDSRLAMATLLARFKKTAQYQHQRQHTTERICHLLTKMLNKPSVLRAFCDMAYESSKTCDDRTALGLIEMELAIIECDLITKTATLSPPQAIGGIVNAGLRVFKQRKLMDIAHEHAKHSKGAVDETEIVLKYITRLGKTLELPVALNNMLYERHAWQVSDKDLLSAKTTIEKAATKNSPEFTAFLQKWYPFQAVLKQHVPIILAHIETKCFEIDETGLVEIENTRKIIQRLKQAHTEHLNNSLDPNTPNLEDEIKMRVENATEVLNATVTLNQITQQRQEDHAKVWKPAIQKAIELSCYKRPANTAPNGAPESSKKPRIDGPH